MNIHTAASVDCERTFSLSGHTITLWRASLSDKSIQSSVLLNSWTWVPGLVGRDEFMETLSNGWKRGAVEGIG